MGASTRLEHAKTHAVRGGSENQSRANKEITSVAHKNIVNAPRQRHVLSDVTNCSPLKTPSRDQIEQQGVKKESNKTRDKMEQELEQAVLTEAQKDLPTSSLAPTKRSLRPRKNKETEAVEAPKSPASEPQEIPKSPVATKTPVAKRPARQSKLKVQNRKLSLDATDNSSVSQSERTGDEPVRRTSKRISIRNASLVCPPKAQSPSCPKVAPKAKESQPASRTKKKIQPKIDTLLSSQILKSPVSSQKSSSPRKSTRSSPKKPVDGKKVPIWKSEPKPEPLRSKPGDVYDIEYDPKDVKQKRKRRPKTSEPAKRAKKQRIEPENLPPIELKLPGEEKSAKTNKAVQKAASPAPQCLQPDEIERLEEEAVLPERPSTLVLPLDESIVGPSTGGCPASTPINTSTPFMNEQSSMAFDPITPIVEVRVEVAEHQDEIMFSSNAVEVEQAQCKPARPHLSLDNCFGFDEPEEEPQTAGPAVMKSTPLRAPRAQANAPFRPSPSPVRKVVDSNRKSSGSRPARLDRNLARDIVGIHPVGAAQDRKKQKTLKEFVEETEPVDRSYEEGKREYSPPTPPTVFTAPPRRSYSKKEMRKIQRAIFEEHVDVEDDNRSEGEKEENDENDDSNASQRKKKKKTANKKPKKTKQEKLVDDWAEKMAAHFDDIDKSELILSD